MGSILLLVLYICSQSAPVFCNTFEWSTQPPAGFTPSIYQGEVEKASEHGTAEPIKFGSRKCNGIELLVAYKQCIEKGKVFVAVFLRENETTGIWRLAKDTAHTNEVYENIIKRLFNSVEELETAYKIPETRVKEHLQSTANFMANASAPILTALAVVSPGAATCLILIRLLTDVVTNTAAYDVANKIRLLGEGKELYDNNKSVSDLSGNIKKNPSKFLNLFGMKIVEKAKPPIGDKVEWGYEVPSDFIFKSYQEAVEKAAGHGSLMMWQFGSRGDTDELFVSYKQSSMLNGQYVVAIFKREGDGYTLEIDPEETDGIFNKEIKKLYKTLALVEIAYTINEAWAEVLSERQQKTENIKTQLPAKDVLPFLKVGLGTKCRLLLRDFMKEVANPTEEGIIMEAKAIRKDVVANEAAKIDYGAILKAILTPNIMPKDSASHDASHSKVSSMDKLVWTDVYPKTFDPQHYQNDVEQHAGYGVPKPIKYGQRTTNDNKLFVAYQHVNDPEQFYVAIFQGKGTQWELVKDADDTETFKKGIKHLYKGFYSLETAYDVQDCVVHEMAHRIPTALNDLSVLGKLVELYTNPELCERLFFFMQNVNGQHDTSNLLEKYRVFKRAADILQNLTSVVAEIAQLSGAAKSLL